MDELAQALSELWEAGEIDGDAQPIVVVVERGAQGRVGLEGHLSAHWPPAVLVEPRPAAEGNRARCQIRE